VSLLAANSTNIFAAEKISYTFSFNFPGIPREKTYDNGIFSVTNASNNWTPITDGLRGPQNLYPFLYEGYKKDGLYISGIAANDSTVFASSINTFGPLYYRGNTWKLSDYPCGSTEDVLVKGANIYTIFPFSGNLNVSTDNGLNFYDLFGQGLENTAITKLETNGSNLFALERKKVFMSVNDGRNWGEILSTSDVVTALVADNSKIIVGTLGGALLSTNNGSSWTEINTGLGNSVISALAISGNKVFAGTTENGIYFTTDNGQNWVQTNTGFVTPLDKKIRALIVSGTNIYAGTSIGVWKRSVDNFRVNSEDLKDKITISILPNPVSNTLTINCSNDLIGKKYAITNILGETIKTDILTNISTQLNVQNLANGIYFLTLIGTNKTLKFVKE
jgi:ligand-binding sensor domain-containing protein